MPPRYISTLCLLNDCAVEDYSSLSEVKIHYAPRLRRRRITPPVFLVSLLMFLTMNSAFAGPTGFESVLDESAVESEPEESDPSRDSKVISPHDCLLKKSKSGLTKMYQQELVPSLTDRPLHRLPRRHGMGRRFTSPGDRRVLVSTACTNKDISIFQSPDGSSGIPRYAVQIMNNCMAECAPSDIHVYCGWFASALLVNPNSFKRLAFDDCIVNGGQPLKHGETLRFTCNPLGNMGSYSRWQDLFKEREWIFVPKSSSTSVCFAQSKCLINFTSSELKPND